VVISDEDDADNNNSNENVAGYARGNGLVAKRARSCYFAADQWHLAFAFIINFHEVGIPESSAAPTARMVKSTKKPVSGKKRRAGVLSSDDEDNDEDSRRRH
jgi:hypothetical protein